MPNVLRPTGLHRVLHALGGHYAERLTDVEVKVLFDGKANRAEYPDTIWGCLYCPKVCWYPFGRLGFGDDARWVEPNEFVVLVQTRTRIFGMVG